MSAPPKPAKHYGNYTFMTVLSDVRIGERRASGGYYCWERAFFRDAAGRFADHWSSKLNPTHVPEGHGGEP